jgi:hypothetical protein
MILRTISGTGDAVLSTFVIMNFFHTHNIGHSLLAGPPARLGEVFKNVW